MNLLLTLIFLSSLCVINTFSECTNTKEEVKVYPFFALHSLDKKLHLVRDEFRLVQNIDLGPIIEHIHSISKGFVTVKRKYDNLNVTASNVSDTETKLSKLLQQLAEIIDAGIQLLPHHNDCLNRKKRGIIPEVDEEVVDVHPLFPSVGKLFSWVTGSLSVTAGKYINANYNNVKRLTRISRKFALMFNNTLKIEEKHKAQLVNIKNQVTILETKFNLVNKLENKIAYLEFLNNLNVVVMDLTRDVDNIFSHADQIELNKIGPLSRDPSFLRAVTTLMDTDIQNKRNILYLMKLSATVDIEACNWIIKITYKFPVIDSQDLCPRKVIEVPKEIKGKFFALSQKPYMITWSDRVYIFTEDEFQNCREFNRNIFCKVPSHTQGFLKSCIYGIINKIPWEKLSSICPITYISNPQDFIEITSHYLIYFNVEIKYATLLCPVNFKGQPKTVPLMGSGIVRIPTGCKIKYNDVESYAFGHVRNSEAITFMMDSSLQNFSSILPLLNIVNVMNVSSLWDDTKAEEQIIEEGIVDTLDILDDIKFTPSGATITLLSLIAYTTVGTFVMFLVIYMICVPGSAMKIKFCCCCCCRSKPRVVDANIL